MIGTVAVRCLWSANILEVLYENGALLCHDDGALIYDVSQTSNLNGTTELRWMSIEI